MAIVLAGMMDIQRKTVTAQQRCEKWRGLISKRNLAICLTELNYICIRFQTDYCQILEFHDSLTSIKTDGHLPIDRNVLRIMINPTTASQFKLQNGEGIPPSKNP